MKINDLYRSTTEPCMPKTAALIRSFSEQEVVFSILEDRPDLAPDDFPEGTYSLPVLEFESFFKPAQA